MGSEFIGSGELDEMIERFLTWLRQHLRGAQVSKEADRWTLAMQYQASAQQVNDRRASAVAQGLMILLGHAMDVTNPAFRNAAAVVKKTRALVDSLRSWRGSVEICSVTEDVLGHQRVAAGHEVIEAANRARDLSPWWRWSAWLRAAQRKSSDEAFVQPLLKAGREAPSRPPWWRWTVWLWAAMNIRRREFLQHDLPERIESAASAAEAFQAIASILTHVLYMPDDDVLAAKRRRGRPTDHLRRELYDTLAEGGLKQHEIADLIEDQAGAKLERLRGRRRRSKRDAGSDTGPSATPGKSRRMRRR